MNKKNIVVPIIILALIGLGYFGWFYKDKLFPKPPKEEKVYKVAIVLLGGAYQQAVDGLKDELQRFGYTEGKNILYYIKDAQGDQEAIAPAAQELLKENPDLFYTVATPVTTRVWKVVGTQLPIVFNIVGDPIGSGFAKSFSSSETNLTGCSNLSAGLSGKRLELFRKAFPNLKKTVTFYDPDNKFSQLSIANTREAAPKLGIEVAEIHVKTTAEIERVLGGLKPGEYDGVFLTPDAMVISNVELVIKRAKELGLPVMGHERTLAEKGVTVTYGADFYPLGVQCASTVVYILKGQSPKDIPIQTPRELIMVVNLKSAQESGLTISEEILKIANTVIR